MMDRYSSPSPSSNEESTYSAMQDNIPAVRTKDSHENKERQQNTPAIEMGNTRDNII
jgi:hypothetical protein